MQKPFPKAKGWQKFLAKHFGFYTYSKAQHEMMEKQIFFEGVVSGVKIAKSIAKKMQEQAGVEPDRPTIN